MSEELNNRLNTDNVIWNLNDLYSGLDDPQINKTNLACQKEAEEIESTFSGKIAKLEAGEILEIVTRLESLFNNFGKLSTFAFLYFTTRIQNAEASAFLQRIREQGSAVSRHTVFFQLEWSEVSDDDAAPILADSKLNKYRHYLQNVRKYAPFLLSQNEEKLLVEISPVGRGAWNLLFDKVMGDIKFGNKRRTEEEVLSDLYDPEQEVRKQAAADLTAGLQSQFHILTHITNTLLADKMIDDRLRNYPTWLSSMNLYNELQDSSVETLVDCVTERYDIVKRYYHFKQKQLGLAELFDYDRYAPLPNLPGQEVSWLECKDLVLKAFHAFSNEMGDIATMFFDKNWIHAPIGQEKRGGAFAHPCSPDVHPYVMVNYTGNIRDVSTVAHELGHGVHQYLATKQGYYNSDTPLVLAETASVFAELLLFHYQVELLQKPKERTAFIAQKLESIFATVFRQVAMNRFEDLTHNARRKQGELSSENISTFWMQTQESMFGDSVKLTKDYASWWSYIPHFLNSPGYVYSYAFGELLVLALYSKYKEAPASFVPLYTDLLSAGGSNDPYSLVEPFGINLNDKEFWQSGLKTIDNMLKMIE